MIKITLEQVLRLIRELFNGLEEESGVYRLSLRNIGIDRDEWLELREDVLRTILERLSSLKEKDGIILYDNHSFEILVQEESSSRFSFIRPDKVETNDSVNGLSYVLSRPSNEYLIYLLTKLSTNTPIREVVDPLLQLKLFLRFSLKEREFERDLLFWLVRAMPRFLTLQIRSEGDMSVSEFERLASAFLFQLSYNLNVAVVPQRSLDKLVRRGRITRLRRSRPEEIEAPKRIYIPDLVYYYQMAIAAESPPLEYLSFYHIVEYFFESVFYDDLIERVRYRITEPSFSHKRKQDIKKLIDEVTRFLRIRNDKLVFSEEEALRLTLNKFLNVGELLSSIKEYDESLIDHFRSRKVSFSGGDEVDLEHMEQDKIIRSLSKRIYKTRNAIVHSKESEKSRYIPFRHDQELAQEVVLLRFIAEQIIIHSSEVL